MITATDLGHLPFYLTQRLTRRDSGHGKGFDALFSCQYMGSSEFEWGAIPESLTRIRAAKKRLVIHEGHVTGAGITATVFVIGDKRRVELVPAALTDWMADDRPHAKESTWFPELVAGTSQDWMAGTDAWWALRSDVMWTLDAAIADDLLRAVAS